MAKRTRVKHQATSLPLAIFLSSLAGAPVFAQDAAPAETPPADAQTQETSAEETAPEAQAPNPATAPVPAAEPVPAASPSVSTQNQVNSANRAQPEQIIVTGSRIKRIDAEGSTPTKVLR